MPGPGGSAPGGVCSEGLLSGVVCSQRGAWLGGGAGPRGFAPGGCLVWGVGTTTRDYYCCGRYASYWNAFLFTIIFKMIIYEKSVLVVLLA